MSLPSIVEDTELLKLYPDQALVREMQNPTGSLGGKFIPPIFITTELKNRQRIRNEQKRREAADQPTVAEEVVMAAGVPQQGIMQMAKSMAPKTNMGQNTGIASMMPKQPTMGMSDGGVVKMQSGGTFKEQTQRILTEQRANPDSITNTFKAATIERALNGSYGKDQQKFVVQAAIAGDYGPELQRQVLTEALAGEYGDEIQENAQKARVVLEQSRLRGFEPTDTQLAPTAAMAETVVPQLKSGLRGFEPTDTQLAPTAATAEKVVSPSRGFVPTDNQLAGPSPTVEFVKPEFESGILKSGLRGFEPTDTQLAPTAAMAETVVPQLKSGLRGFVPTDNQLAGPSPTVEFVKPPKPPTIQAGAGIRGADTKPARELAELLGGRQLLPGVDLPGPSTTYEIDPTAALRAGEFLSSQQAAGGMPAMRDPAVIDPTTGQPYDVLGSMRQQAEQARQAEAQAEFVRSLSTPDELMVPFDSTRDLFDPQGLNQQREDRDRALASEIAASGREDELSTFPIQTFQQNQPQTQELLLPTAQPTGRQSLDGRMVSTVGPTAAEIERAQKVLEMNPSATAPKEDVDVLASAFTAKPSIQYTEAGDLTDELVDQPQALTYDQLVKKQSSGAKVTEDDLVRSVEAGLLNDQQAADVRSMIDSDYVPTAQSQEIANLGGVSKFTRADNTANPDMLVPKAYDAATDFLAGVLPEKALGIIPINPGGPRTVREQMDIDAERKKKSDAYKAYAKSKGIDLSNVGTGLSISGFSNVTDLFNEKPDTSDPKKEDKKEDKVADTTFLDNQPQTTEELIKDLDKQDKTTTVNKAAAVVQDTIGAETLAVASGVQGTQAAAQAQQGFSDKQWLDIAALGMMISSGNPADLREASKLFIKLQEASRGRKSKEKMAAADRASNERIAKARVNATIAATEQRRAAAKARNSLDALETIAASVQDEMNKLMNFDGKTVPSGNKDAYDKLKSSLDRIMKDIASMGGTSLAAYGADDMYQDNIDIG